MTPSFLMRNPELVEADAPWCRLADNMELGILLLSAPWVAGEGLRRAELERQLAHLGRDMPLGAVYFQRVRRAAAALETSGALEGSGTGRARRFVATPQGFAALILNLRVLVKDPTIDGSEFEMKRALVAMWSVLVDRMATLPNDVVFDERCERFFDDVESITLWGQKVVTRDLVDQALNIASLVADARTHVATLRADANRRLASTKRELRELPDIVDAETLALVQSLTSRTLPALSQRATLERYDAYLGYLDALAALYAEELAVADFGLFRRRLSG